MTWSCTFVAVAVIASRVENKLVLWPRKAMRMSPWSRHSSGIGEDEYFRGGERISNY
jgi:hypothetical protein